ncbi:hypothetical protein D9615_003106 [Tricholomella constricta]|uniref:Uncharacterized protein n=1 Tax=Tricholomella constricta TaxID=117010 RepID=A0A8H5M7Y4_9AGAR|nr:hypothetical protein D9615_003106 [Tricholomella constricta]
MPFLPEELDKAYQEVVLGNPYIDRELFMGEHLGSAHFWVGIQPFLLHRGYRLRPRYDPQWVAPWLRGPEINQNILAFEESLILGHGEGLLDAVRVSDGFKVVFKRVSTRSPELLIARYLSSPNLRSDPGNQGTRKLPWQCRGCRASVPRNNMYLARQMKDDTVVRGYRQGLSN